MGFWSRAWGFNEENNNTLPRLVENCSTPHGRIFRRWRSVRNNERQSFIDRVQNYFSSINNENPRGMSLRNLNERYELIQRHLLTARNQEETSRLIALLNATSTEIGRIREENERETIFRDNTLINTLRLSLESLKRKYKEVENFYSRNRSSINIGLILTDTMSNARRVIEDAEDIMNNLASHSHLEYAATIERINLNYAVTVNRLRQCDNIINNNNDQTETLVNDTINIIPIPIPARRRNFNSKF